MSKIDELSAIAENLARYLGAYVGNYKGSPFKEDSEKVLNEYKSYLVYWNSLRSEEITYWGRLETKIMTVLSEEDRELSEVRDKAEEIVELVKCLKIEDRNESQEEKSYIIVYDTFGDGLIANPEGNSHVEIYCSKEDLDDGIVDTYYTSGKMLGMDVEEDTEANESVVKSLVICEVVDMEDYAKGILNKHLKSGKEEEYKTYLKLKEKFEGCSFPGYKDTKGNI